MRYVIEGWPVRRDQSSADVKPYWSYKEEISLINGILFKGERLIIPASMRKAVLKQLHQAHLGIEKTKWRARATIFWPQINQQIEEMVKTCSTCLHNQKQHPREPMMPSDVPHYPFQMVGSDLFHWNDQDFVLVVDYYSRYWEIEKLHKTDAATVIKKIKNVFSRMGIPEVLRSDNGPQYAAKTFEKFAKDWGFQHIPSSPEYPRSNGLAEKTVQTVKDLLEKAKEDNKDPYLAMLEVRNTPVDNYKSPAELAFGRQLRSILPVSPNNLTVKSVDNDEFKQRRSDLKGKQKEYYDQHTKELKNLHNGENIRMFRDGKWKPASVVQKLSKPRSYIVKADNGRMYQRNRSKLLKTEIDEDQTIEVSDDDGEGEIINIKTEDESDMTNQEEQQGNNTEVRTRSGRISRRPKRFEDYQTF